MRSLYFAAVVSIFFLFSSFPCLYSQRPEIECLPYCRTWYGHSANLEFMSAMCCTRLAENTRRKNYAKNRHLRTIAQLCRTISCQLRHASTIAKELIKQQYLLHMSSQYGKFVPLTDEIGWPVWGTPANFDGFRLMASLLYTDVAQRRPAKLCTMFGCVLGYTFVGFLPPKRILPGAKFILRPSLAFSCIGSVTARH